MTIIEAFEAETRKAVVHAVYIQAEWIEEVDECLAPIMAAQWGAKELDLTGVKV